MQKSLNGFKRKKGRREKLTEKQRERLLKDIQNGKLTYLEIARKFNISVQAVYGYKDRYL